MVPVHAVEGLLGLLAVAGGVVVVDDDAGKPALEGVGVAGAGGQVGLDGVDLMHVDARGETVVAHDEVVGDGHDLAEHVVGRVGEAHVVAVGLAHLAHAVGALEQRHAQGNLGLHAHLLHELTAGEQVEELVTAAHLHVGVDHDRVVGLHHGVEELVQGDGGVARVALREVVALKDAGDGELAGNLEQLAQVHGQDPVAVVDDLGLGRVEDLHGLLDVGLGVELDLLMGELRARGVLARRVADERGAVADNEGDVVTQVLELAHLLQGHGVAQVQVGARGVNAELDVERATLLELLLEALDRHDCVGARGDDAKLLFD